MKVSVITTVYNRPEHFRLMLAALAAQSRRPDEVVVADDGSDADTVSARRAHVDASPLPCVFVRQEKDGYRLAAARNLATRAATGDYLVFADCDIALLPDAIENHLHLASPDRLLCGNRALLGEDATARLFAARPAPTAADWEAAWRTADASHLPPTQAQFEHHAALRRWHLARPHKPKIIGCHFSLFRDDVVRVNGFDENFVGWGYEDDDFARRLYKIGVRPASVILAARAMHLWHPSLAPQELKRHRDRPNRAYFRRWFVPAFCKNGLVKRP